MAEQEHIEDDCNNGRHFWFDPDMPKVIMTRNLDPTVEEIDVKFTCYYCGKYKVVRYAPIAEGDEFY